MQIKKISGDHYLGVSDEQIKKGDWYLADDKKILLCGKILFGLLYADNDYGRNPNSCKKITHSTIPIEETDRTFMSVTFGWDKIQKLDLSYIKSLVGEVDVVELSNNETKGRVFANGVHEEVVAQMFYRKGYNQCLEDNKRKIFTWEDMYKAILFGRNIPAPKSEEDEYWEHEKNFIESLAQPKDTWECEFIEGQLKLKV